MNEIKLKRVEKHDKLLIYSWFNELENIKLKIKTKHKISIREHNIWFNKILNSKKKKFWLIITKNKIAGQIRLDLIDKDIFEVDIFIIKNLRGLNIKAKINYLPMQMGDIHTLLLILLNFKFGLTINLIHQ